MGIMVYSLLWVMQDFVHQAYGLVISIVTLLTTLFITTHERPSSVDLQVENEGQNKPQTLKLFVEPVLSRIALHLNPSPKTLNAKSLAGTRIKRRIISWGTLSDGTAPEP